MIKPEISYRYYPATDGSSNTYAHVYIVLKDTETNDFVNGNGIIIYFTQYINSSTGAVERSIPIRGQNTRIYSGQIYENTRWTFGQHEEPHEEPEDSPEINVCTIRIRYITINKPESAPGESDARITVVADSANQMEYSIDNGDTWHLSPVFSGLSGGYLVVKARDVNSITCTTQSTITLPVITSVLTGEPVISKTKIEPGCN